MLLILGFYSFNASAAVNTSRAQGIMTYVNQQARTFRILIRVIDQLGLNSPVITLTEQDKKFLIETNPAILGSLSRVTDRTRTEDLFTQETRYTISSPADRGFLISQISNHLRVNSLNYAGASIVLTYTFANPVDCLGANAQSAEEYNQLNQQYIRLDKEAKDLKELLEDRINAPYFKDAVFKTFVPLIGLVHGALGIKASFQASAAMRDFGRLPNVSAALYKELAETAGSRMLSVIVWPIVTLIGGVMQYRDYSNNLERQAELDQFAKDLYSQTENLYKSFGLDNKCISSAVSN